ncbi:hypothetical protein [Marinovum algicola]|uniref:hypothetical protein n=1 Tax=Marinovum algicola TaxID=42444 RepID=UPI003B5229FF
MADNRSVPARFARVTGIYFAEGMVEIRYCNSGKSDKVPVDIPQRVIALCDESGEPPSQRGPITLEAFEDAEVYRSDGREINLSGYITNITPTEYEGVEANFQAIGSKEIQKFSFENSEVLIGRGPDAPFVILRALPES